LIACIWDYSHQEAGIKMVNRMRLFVSVVAIGAGVLLATPNASAQDATTTDTARAGRGERGSRGGSGRGIAVLRIAGELEGLSADQKEKVEKLQTDFRTKLEEARKKASTDSSSSEAKTPGGRGGWNSPEMQKLNQEAKTEVEKILTEDQKKALETKLAEQRGRYGSGQTTGTARRRQ
jgi:hypothetical protein